MPLQVDIGDAQLERVVERRIDHLDGRAGGIADRGKAQVFQRARVARPHLAIGHHIVHGAHRLLLLGQEGVNVGSEGDAVFEIATDQAVDPDLQILIEGVGHRRQQCVARRIAAGAQDHSTSLLGAGQRDDIESGIEIEHLGRLDDAVTEMSGNRPEQRTRLDAREHLQFSHHRAP
jgi:hypothetical protein